MKGAGQIVYLKEYLGPINPFLNLPISGSHMILLNELPIKKTETPCIPKQTRHIWFLSTHMEESTDVCEIYWMKKIIAIHDYKNFFASK